MRIAVVSADLKKRKAVAEEISQEYRLPIIAEQDDVFRKKNPEKIEAPEMILKTILERQIKKQILCRDGFVSSGSTLDYVALYKTFIDLKDKEKVNIPDLIKARMHAWRHLDKIIYLPLTQNRNKFYIRYDSYLKAELELIRENGGVQIIALEDRSQLPLLFPKGVGVNGAAAIRGKERDLETV